MPLQITNTQSFRTTPSPINALKLISSSFIFVAQRNAISLYTPDPTPTRLSTYTGHNLDVMSLSFLDTTQFVSVSDVVCLHDVSSESYVRRIGVEGRFRINDVVKLSIDVVACCGDDKKISVFDLRQKGEWRPVQVFDEAKDSLNSLDYEDGMICCGGSEGRLFCYDLRKGTCIADDIGSKITSVSCDKGDVLLGVMGDERAVKLWSVSGQRVSKQFTKQHADDVYKIDSKLVADRQIVTSGSEVGKVYLWNYSNVKDCTELEVGAEQAVVNTVDGVGNLVCCGRGDGELTMFSVAP